MPSRLSTDLAAAQGSKMNKRVADNSQPLDPVTAEELEIALNIIKDAYKDIPLHFKAAGPEEPPKNLMVQYLEAEHAGLERPTIPRSIFLMWYIKQTPRLFEAIVDVTTRTIIHHNELPRDFHGPCDRTELNQAAQVVLADESVKREIARLQLGDNTIVLDPWDYGVDGKETQERHTQVSNRNTEMCNYAYHCQGFHVHAQPRE
jgi:primary-amine oxidase